VTPSLQARWRDDDGVALVITLALTLVMTILVTAVLSSAATSQRQANHDQDWQGALAAAEAGIDDYLFRLNRNDAYWRYPAAGPAPDGNTAFTAWTPVPGAASEGTFRYTVEASRLATEGVLRLTSSGQVRNATRTVETLLRRSGFLNYLYFTEFETLDPVAYPTAEDQNWADVNCSRHRYSGSGRPTTGRPSSPSEGCLEINWVTGDTVRGPFHSNDRLLMLGDPVWEGPASTTSPPPFWVGSGSPQFNGGALRNAPRLDMPPSNRSIRDQADHTIGSDGCLYTGPTQIRMVNNQLKIKSPYTKRTGTGCGAFPTTAEVTIPFPTNGVIYVQNIPAASADENFTPDCTDQGLGYPIAADIAPAGSYSCRNGDAFVEGTYDGRLTIASDNNVILTWDVVRADDSTTSDDVLGLVANQFVELYHPVNAGNQNLNALPLHNGKWVNPRIQAAVLSVNHSFRVQQWAGGDRDSSLGTINLTGAIAQIYRGPVGTTARTGYLKNYVYDQRLQYMSPPHFIEAAVSSWNVATWTEL
jgi:hypothetical protein